MKNAEKRQRDKEWKKTEKLVSVIEKFLTPDSRIEHNHWLPVVGSHRKRQCDNVIFIKSGNKEIKYLVEVQKRKGKVAIGTFEGWVKKMQRVDAQGLICVSEKGFPKSIIEEVKNHYGSNTITLITLKEVDKLINPENIILDLTYDVKQKKFTYGNMTAPLFSEEAANINHQFSENEKIFISDTNPEPFSINQLVLQVISDTTNEPDFMQAINSGQLGRKGIINFVLGTNDNIYALVGDKKVKLLDWKFSVLVSIADVPYTVDTKKFSYHHEIVGNALAWIAKTELKYENETVQVEFLAKMENGEVKYNLRSFKVIE